MAYNIYILMLCFIQAVAAKVPAIIVFGDSSVDTGNNNYIPTIARCDFQPYGRDFPGGLPTGRFCNGRLPPDFLSESFGLKPIVPAYLDPMYDISYFATGVCFASAATGYDNATADILVSLKITILYPLNRFLFLLFLMFTLQKVIPLWRELEFYKDYQQKLRGYLGVEKANEVLGEALYTLSLGTNDFIENYYTIPGGRQSQFTIQQYQDFLLGIAENFLRQLYDLGARKISVTGIPPMGCLPALRTTNFLDHHDCGCNEDYNNVASEFNGKLNNLVAKLNKELPGFRVVFADGYHILLQLIKKPSRFGMYWLRMN